MKLIESMKESTWEDYSELEAGVKLAEYKFTNGKPSSGYPDVCGIALMEELKNMLRDLEYLNSSASPETAKYYFSSLKRFEQEFIKEYDRLEKQIQALNFGIEKAYQMRERISTSANEMAVYKGVK